MERGAISNIHSLTSGWLFQVGITSVYYNVALCLYFLFVVKYNWREQKFRNVIRWVHLGVLLVGLSMSMAVIPFVTADWRWCYLNKPPYYESWLPGVFFFILPIGICMLGMTVIMAFFVRYVHKVESKGKMRRFSESRPNRRSLANRTFWQSLYFLAVFYIVWPIQFVAFIIPLVEGNYWVYFLAALLGPLQGFLNALVVFSRDPKPRQEGRSRKSGLGGVVRKLNLFLTCKQSESAQSNSGFRDWLDRHKSSQVKLSRFSSGEEQPKLPSMVLSTEGKEQVSSTFSHGNVNLSTAELAPAARQAIQSTSIPDSVSSDTSMDCIEALADNSEPFEENVAILEYAVYAGILNDSENALYQDRISVLDESTPSR